MSPFCWSHDQMFTYNIAAFVHVGMGLTTSDLKLIMCFFHKRLKSLINAKDKWKCFFYSVHVINNFSSHKSLTSQLWPKTHVGTKSQTIIFTFIFTFNFQLVLLHLSFLFGTLIFNFLIFVSYFSFSFCWLLSGIQPAGWIVMQLFRTSIFCNTNITGAR